MVFAQLPIDVIGGKGGKPEGPGSIRGGAVVGDGLPAGCRKPRRGVAGQGVAVLLLFVRIDGEMIPAGGLQEEGQGRSHQVGKTDRDGRRGQGIVISIHPRFPFLLPTKLSNPSATRSSDKEIRLRIL